MFGQRLIPTREQVAAILEKTGGFLDHLRDAALIEGAKAPPVPKSAIPYRKVNAVYRWSEWEQVMNPSSASFGAAPAEVVAGGWRDWQALHYALVDLHALRKQLITHWGLAPIVGAKSVRLGWEATGKPGSGEKALYVRGEKDSSSGAPDHLCLERPLDWPPPVPRDWRKQCRYALKRIKRVMEVEEKTPMLSPSNADGQATGQTEASRPDRGQCISMSDLEIVNAALCALGELIKACADFQLAGAERPSTPAVQLAPFQVVKSRAAKITEFATSRLDSLCVKYLRTKPGEWSDGLVDAVRNPVRLEQGDDYKNALRARWNQLSKLWIVLGNDAREVTRFPAGPGVETTGAPLSGPRVMLRGPGARPIVDAVEKDPLTLPQYDVVKALLEAGERGLSKDELDRKSKHGDARKILKRLAESDPGWKAVIHLPGRRGGGYRIR